MSFNKNDNNTIHLGNYEEFFILYMDNELRGDQKKMVEDFLQVNPDLQAELEMLMYTKLPAEEFLFDKEALLAENLKQNTVNEDLLLYMDGELTGEKKKIVELELASNSSCRQHHQLLLQTRLDASEVIAYPNKKELYRGTERRIAFTLWVRMAAAVIVIAATGVLYFAGKDTQAIAPSSIAEVTKSSLPIQNSLQGQANGGGTVTQQPETTNNRLKENSAAVENRITIKEHGSSERSNEAKHAIQQENTIGNAADAIEIASPAAKGTTALTVNIIEPVTASFDPNIEIINTSGVTSALSERNTDIHATKPTVPGNDVAMGNQQKGSFKSFLRKATRLIERKTGVDATNGDDEELLIGAVAVKLK